MHKLITADNRQSFDDMVKACLNNGWSVVHGTMYATVTNVTRKEHSVLTEGRQGWEDNIFVVFLQGNGHQILITSPSRNNFNKFVNECLDRGNYGVIPGTIYAASLEDKYNRLVAPFITVTLQKD